MDFLKQFDIEKVIDLERVAGSALSALDEFPKAAAAPEGKSLASVSGASQARQAYAAWKDADFEGHKQDWETLCYNLRKLQAGSSERWEDRAKSAEYELVKLCSTLLGLPDPTSYIASVSGLTTRIVEVESENRQLHAAAEAAAADNKEVSALVEKHRALETEFTELKEELSKREAELSEAQALAKETQTARAETASTQAELTRAQASLKSLREEHEKLQAQLFDMSSKIELDAGSRQRELDVALEEVEALTQRCAELEMERTALAARHTPADTDNPDSLSGPMGSGGGTHEGAGGVSVSGGGGGGGGEGGGGGGVFWERQLRLRTEQLEAAEARLQVAAREAEQLQEQHAMQLQSVSNQLSAAQLTISKLQSELDLRPSVADHKELRARADALQQLVDVQVDSEGWSQDTVKQYLPALGSAPTHTHNLLQERNRALSSELSKARRVAADMTTETTALKQQITTLKEQSAQHHALIQRLETDLLAVQGIKSSGAPATAAPAMSSGLDTRPSLTVQVLADATQQSVPGNTDKPADGELLEPSTPPAGGGSGGGGRDGLVGILAQQRDRFRQRVTQLEEEKSALAQELSESRRQVDTLRSDNVSLYEKAHEPLELLDESPATLATVRYLEQYSQRAAAQGGGPGGGGARTAVLRVDPDGIPLPDPAQTKAHRYQCGPLSLELGGGSTQSAAPAAAGNASVRARGGRSRVGAGLCFPEDPVDEERGPEGRYTKAYEARVNPFTEFQKNEMDARVQRLQLHDRAVLAGSKLLAGSRFGRLFIALYAVLLHIFILVLLYYAMAPKQRIVEIVDAATLAQHQAAAVKGALRRLLRHRWGHGS